MQQKENIPYQYQYNLSDPPHIRNNQSIIKIMWFVVLALLPSNILAVYFFGFRVLLLLIISVISGLIAESAFQYIRKDPVTISDGSAVITGLLIIMFLPPDIPLWIPAFGSFFSILIIKQLFGGLGYNILNPALAARAITTAIWPSYITSGWIQNIKAIVNEKLSYKIFDTAMHNPFSGLNEIPELTSGFLMTTDRAYYLLLSDTKLKSLFICNDSGFIGEISVILLLLGGLFLFVKKIISWHVPAIYAGTTALILFVYYNAVDFPYPARAVLFHLLTGGFILGAFFMATDFVTSPVTRKGLLIFGAGCGLITSVLRIWGISESVCFAILLMNTAVPFIDRHSMPKIFGTRLKKQETIL
jgi:Na+-translocating ferredoxin:NAD+ oxidoreductase subunit D